MDWAPAFAGVTEFLEVALFILQTLHDAVEGIDHDEETVRNHLGQRNRQRGRLVLVCVVEDAVHNFGIQVVKNTFHVLRTHR
jgi:hypothetical protein